MVSPPSPRGSVPIPSPAESKPRRGSRVFQSSLEIAFSYSRSQQRRYGHIRSAPSFVDVTSSPDEQDGWDGDEAHPGPGLNNELDHGVGPGGGVTGSRRSSDSPNLFPADPFRFSPAENENENEYDPATDPRDARPYSPPIAPRPANERTPLLLSDAKGRAGAGAGAGSPTLSFAPDGIGVPASTSRRRSSVAKRKRVRDVGESTDGQTLFNAIAVLVGIGLLSLPLAFAYAGWIGGTLLLLGFASITCHTAKLLARLILVDRRLLGYTDIGRRAFGGWASGAINVLFCLELFALSVALIVLFGDTLSAIFPSISSDTFKLLGFLIVLPTTLLPLHLLSLPSLLSTLSSLLLILILLIDGFSRSSPPGSILQPSPTNWTPEWKAGNWLGGVGLVLAGFGGHAVVPGLARDMKYPEHFDRIINRAFVIATVISFVAGSAGYLMIGNTVSDEITRDLLQPKFQYPRLLNLFALWMIVINPITKFGLCTRPLNVTIESLLGISPSTPGDESQIFTSGLSTTGSSHRDPDLEVQGQIQGQAQVQGQGMQADVDRTSAKSSSGSHSSTRLSWPDRDRRKTAYRVISRVITTAVCALTAVALPGFGKVMAFLGSFSAFLICIILPLLFYLRLAPGMLGDERPWTRRAHWCLVVVSVGLMVAGTGWAFVPGSGHGGLDDGRE